MSHVIKIPNSLPSYLKHVVNEDASKFTDIFMKYSCILNTTNRRFSGLSSHCGLVSGIWMMWRMPWRRIQSLNWGSQNLGRKAYVAPIYRDDAEDSHSAFTFDLGFSKGASQHPLSYLFCLIRMQLESSDVPGVVSVLTDCCTNLLRKFGGSTFRGKTGINPGYSGATLM